MKIISSGLLVVLIGGLSVFAQPVPVAGQKDVAIVYASRYGSTARTAEWIAAGMAGKAAVVSVSDVGDLSGYKKVILGSGIYFDKLHPEMDSFLEKRGEEVGGKLLAIFVVCGTPPGQAGGYLDMFAGKCKDKPLLMRAFNGWTKKELLSPEDFKSLENYYKSVNEPFENSNNTDKAKCLEFGKEILAKMREVK
jgi:menaquinone-dependent protoporphyrinogen IX oxidase